MLNAILIGVTAIQNPPTLPNHWTVAGKAAPWFSKLEQAGGFESLKLRRIIKITETDITSWDADGVPTPDCNAAIREYSNQSWVMLPVRYGHKTRGLIFSSPKQETPFQYDNNSVYLTLSQASGDAFEPYAWGTIAQTLLGNEGAVFRTAYIPNSEATPKTPVKVVVRIATEIDPTSATGFRLGGAPYRFARVRDIAPADSLAGPTYFPNNGNEYLAPGDKFRTILEVETPNPLHLSPIMRVDPPGQKNPSDPPWVTYKYVIDSSGAPFLERSDSADKTKAVRYPIAFKYLGSTADNRRLYATNIEKSKLPKLIVETLETLEATYSDFPLEPKS
jgi:hypothetical protein